MKWVCISNEPFPDDEAYRFIQFKPAQEKDEGSMTLIVPVAPEFDYQVDKSYCFQTANASGE